MKLLFFVCVYMTTYYTASCGGQDGYIRRSSTMDWIVALSHDAQKVSFFRLHLIMFLVYVFMKYKILEFYCPHSKTNWSLAGKDWWHFHSSSWFWDACVLSYGRGDLVSEDTTVIRDWWRWILSQISHFFCCLMPCPLPSMGWIRKQ